MTSSFTRQPSAGEGRDGVRPPRPVHTYLFLAQVSTDIELDVIRRWVGENYPLGGRAPELIRLPYPKGQMVDELEAALGTRLDRTDDPLLVPLRVAWLPKARNGERQTRLRDLLLFGDPRRPRPTQQRWIFRTDQARAEVLVAEPASLSELWGDYRDEVGPDVTGRLGPFNRFVGRRATVALERAESQRLGPQYKIPRLVREEIWTSLRFQDGLRRTAGELGRATGEVEAEAEAYLDEMVTGYNRLQIDVTQELGRRTFRRSYDEELDLDPDQVARVQAAAKDHAVVVLPTHRSNHDAGVMPVAWHTIGLPRTHTLAGLNMAFWPMGAIMRRSGVIFIRRDIRDNPVYRYVLREYVGFLVEKRFHLEWYIEGGRSRTGKLLPPKLGLLTYVIDAFAEGRVDDVVLAPVSIAYDQLKEVSEYVEEAKGAAKKPETAAWFLRFLRNREAYGKVYVRFGEPVSLRESLGRPKGLSDKATKSQQLQKLGFEVSWRINRATPITATALVTLALLSARGVAMTFVQLRVVLNEHLAFVDSRGLPTTESCRALAAPAGIQKAVDALAAKGVVDAEASGPETVYLIGTDQHLAAAFYRNSIIHFFLERSIAELALLEAARPEVTDREGAFWDEAMALRDLLKFEFFFPDRDDYVRAIDGELEAEDPDWRSYLAGGETEVWTLVESFGLHTAHTVLRSFLEAYQVVASVLERLGDAAAPGPKDLLARCEGLGKQYLLQWRIASPESVSRHLFETGIQLAANRDLLDSGTDLALRRLEFALEIRGVVTRIHDLETLASARLRREMDRRAEPSLRVARRLQRS